jgi:hypothetical protein
MSHHTSVQSKATLLRTVLVPLVMTMTYACSGTGSGAGGSDGGATGSGGGGTGGTSQVVGTGGAGTGGRTSSGAPMGGVTGSGGAASTGGLASTGGRSGAGGSSAGGVIGTGGLVRPDGGLGTGGQTRDAAAPGTGGIRSNDGAVGSGGAQASGGGAGAGVDGGSGGGGGSAPAPYKGVANSPAAEIATLGATWCYNWGTKPEASDCNDPLFVPMIWGSGDVAGAIKAIGKAGYKTVLGFNEPNKSDQANMSVDSAIALWPAMTSDPNIRVGSPAVSDDGRSWLESFMTQAQAKGLRVDFIAMHWYGWNAGSCVAGQLEGAVNWASKWNLPIWITEFGCMGSSNTDEKTLIDFFNNAIAMLKKHPLVERYAWYPWNKYNDLYLADSKGTRTITALGQAFAAAPQFHP